MVIDGALERSGKGTHTTVSGIRMSGEWKADALKGEGRLEHPSGTRYEGLFANNQFQGRGKYIWPDGSATKDCSQRAGAQITFQYSKIREVQYDNTVLQSIIRVYIL